MEYFGVLGCWMHHKIEVLLLGQILFDSYVEQDSWRVLLLLNKQRFQSKTEITSILFISFIDIRG